jgi:hypothetical protein
VPALNAIVGRDKKIKISICFRKEQLADRKVAWLQSQILIRKASFVCFRLENNHSSIIKAHRYALQIIRNMETLAISHVSFSTNWQDEPRIFAKTTKINVNLLKIASKHGI